MITLTLFVRKWEECVLGIKTTPTKHILKMEPSQTANRRRLQAMRLP